jgi:predicted PurR-regulated permease PerM
VGASSHRTPVEQILGIGFLLLLAVGCILVLLPFLSALIWAAVLCFSTWPIYRQLERALRHRKGLAAAVMTLLVTFALVAPLAIVVASLANNVGSLVSAGAHAFQNGLPLPPVWLAKVPVIGKGLTAYWENLALNAPALINELKGLIRPAADLVIASGKRIGSGLVEFSLSVLISFFFYRHGETITVHGRGYVRQFAGPLVQRILTIAQTTVKAVLYGLLGTGLVQAILAAIGFWIADVPLVLLLSFLTFVLSFAPIGPPLVWGAVAFWLLTKGALWQGVFIALWGFFLVSLIDNFLRPYLIGKSSALPILLSFFGLVGGVVAFGMIGVFLGPMLLAIAYSLIREWPINATEEAPPISASP